jgi:DNA-binding transcriptional LysR family regulator
MEIYQIRTFLAVVEERSVTRAAKRLFTTPPSVSAHVKALEEELGVVLFERSSKGMELTPAGQAIRVKAEQVLQATLEVAAKAAGLRRELQGGLEIGLNTDAAFLRVSRLAAIVRERHPSIELNFVATNSQGVIDGIRTDALDVGFVYGEREVHDLQMELLSESTLVVTIPAALRPGSEEEVDWQSMSRLPWVYPGVECPFQQVVDRTMGARGLICAAQVKADDDATRRELVRAGVGVAVLEREEAERLRREAGAVLWEPSPRLLCPLWFAHSRRRLSDPLIRAIVECVRDVWRQA